MLLLFGSTSGGDLDITDESFVPMGIPSSPNSTTFASIYDLNNGPTLIGQYFFGGNTGSSGNKGEISLIGDNLMISSPDNKNIRLFDYQYNPLVSLTNIPFENDNTPTSYSSLVSFNIFPNPASSYWEIKSDTNINSVQLFDISGKKVFEKKYNSKRVKVNSISLEDGVYIILVNHKKSFVLIKN